MKELRVKRYIKLAEILRDTTPFTTVRMFAETLGWKELQVRCSMRKAREHLALSGIIVVNEMGKGYRIGTFTEFVVEMNKSTKRAISQLSMALKYINILEDSELVDGDFLSLKNTITKSMISIIPIIDDEEICEDLDWEEREEYFSMNRITPEHINEIAEEEV